MSNRKEGIASDVIAALLALSAILTAFQYRTLSKFSVLPPGRAYVNLDVFIDTVRREVILDTIDGMLCFLLLVPVLYILVVEVMHRKFTGFLAWIFSDERRTVLALALTSLVSVRYYFASGALSWAGDAPQHISYLDITSEILSNFELPIWTNYFGAGSPFLQFYGFLYFLIGGALNLVVGDVNLTGKLILGVSHAASGMGVYFLCRILLGSRRAAFLAGLGYVLCFWHAQQVIVMGRHPVGLFYALLPWTYVFLERCLRARDWHRHAASGAICHAMLVFTHPGYGLYATAFLSLYGLLRSIELRSLATAYRGAAVVGIGLILSAPQTLPMVVERATTRLSLGRSLAATKVPTLQHILGWSNYRFSLFPLPTESQHWYGGYLGLSLVMIAIAGIVFTIQRRPRPAPLYLAPLGCVCLAFLLPFVSSSSLLKDVPLIPNFSGGRYLLFTVFFLSISVGVGARFLSAPCFGRGPSRQFTILLGLVLLDLGPTTFQQPYGIALAPVTPPGREKNGELDNFRNFYTLKDRNPYDAMGTSQLISRTPAARAPHPGDLLLQTHFVEPLEQSLTQVLPDSMHDLDWSRLGLFHTGLDMLNIRNVYLNGPHLARLPWHSPVLVSAKTVSLPQGDRLIQEAIPSEEQRSGIKTLLESPDDADWISRSLALIWTLGQSTIDRKRGSLANIVMTGSSPPADLGTDPGCVVNEHHVWNTRALINVDVTDHCYARLAYAYFPYLTVTVDGISVEPQVTMGRFMAIQLSPGNHVIELTATLSPLRKALWFLDLLLLVGWFAWGNRWQPRVLSETKEMSVSG